MERLPRQKYTKEFREQAVRVVREQELTVSEAARRLAMSEKTLANWVFRARQGQLAGLGETRRPVTDLEAEVARLKRELAEARMERDILKKATVSSTGHGNTIGSTIDAEEDLYGANGASGFVCGPESGALAAMETGTVVERDWPCARQACRIHSRRCVVERGIHSYRPTTVTVGADVGGTRRDFAWRGNQAFHPADRRPTWSSAIDGQPRTHPPWRDAHVSRR